MEHTEEQLNEYRAFARSAEMVQSACNAVAIVNAFAACVTATWRSGYYENNGDAIARDAPFIAFLDKLFDMAGRPTYSQIGDAHNEVARVVEDLRRAQNQETGDAGQHDGT